MGEKTTFIDGELYIIDPETGEQQPFSFSQLDEITGFEADSTDKEKNDFTPPLMNFNEEITLHLKMDKKSFKKMKRVMLRAEIKRQLKYIIALIKWRCW